MTNNSTTSYSRGESISLKSAFSAALAVVNLLLVLAGWAIWEQIKDNHSVAKEVSKEFSDYKVLITREIGVNRERIAVLESHVFGKPRTSHSSQIPKQQ